MFVCVSLLVLVWVLLVLLQVCFFSATLHSPQITSLAEQICHNPAWVDLKGNDTVPDTVRA